MVLSLRFPHQSILLTATLNKPQEVPDTPHCNRRSVSLGEKTPNVKCWCSSLGIGSRVKARKTLLLRNPNWSLLIRVDYDAAGVGVIEGGKREKPWPGNGPRKHRKGNNQKYVAQITASLFRVYSSTPYSWGDRGGTVLKVLCYKSEGNWFDPRWCHWNFSIT